MSTLLGDFDEEISRAYGVLHEELLRLRGVFVIDRDGIVRYKWVGDDLGGEPDLWEAFQGLDAGGGGKMKFRCRECGALFYSDEPLQVCDFCEGKLEEIAPSCTRMVCAEWGREVEVIHGIPACEHFVLNNAPGSRCLCSAHPQRCAMARLPEYQPRVGVILPEGAER